MKIATWNVNSLRVRLAQVLDWLERERPDALALQETKVTDELFPAAAFAEAGYHCACSGQPTYNGVALVSRAEPAGVLREIPGLEDPQRRFIAATLGPVRVISLYVVNGKEVGSDKYAYKLEWLARVREHLRAELAAHPLLAVLGDFNVAPEDRDVHAPEEWRERILCSTPEREALASVRALGLEDVYRALHDEPGGFTWWDYRAAAFRRDRGLRIDLVLASAALAARLTGCRVDREARAAERPSDHAPLSACFALEETPPRP